ncbi:MAG: hypothetical protein DRG78_00900 [Epsilonproteobacteria bacterium]|nr:MAG: hypothetical protein DRG78_00900 [Campylobacterota bacterium]
MNNKKNLISEAIADIEYLEDKDIAKKETAFKKSHQRKFGGPPGAFEDPIYKELKEIIICKDLKQISIKRWDELEVNFSNQTIRFCPQLKQDITKVTNEHNYNAIKNNNMCIAIPYNGVLQQVLDDDTQQYIENYVFIQVSRRLIQGFHYQEEYDIKENNIEDAIKFILYYIKEDIENSRWKDIDSWIKDYQEFDIDLTIILENENFKGIVNG